MKARLYVIPLSHAAAAARLMVEHKALEHDRVELLSGLHPIFLRVAGFRGDTVPALRLGDGRVQGSLSISRYLDEVLPEPPLFPRDAEARRRVEEAESWGESVLQHVPRRLFRWALVRDPGVRRLLARENRLPLAGVAAVLMKPLAAHFAGRSGASDETVRRHVAELPALLDHVDAYIASGVIGASVPNAATFQIAPSLRLLMNFEQLAPLFDERPAGRLARELLPVYPGRVPCVFPDAWLPT